MPVGAERLGGKALVLTNLHDGSSLWKHCISAVLPYEFYYAYYMKHISGPWSEESRDWLKEQRNEFSPMLEAQKRVSHGELISEALLAYNSLQQKYSAYQRVLQSNISY